jgi:hypothetical protein
MSATHLIIAYMISTLGGYAIVGVAVFAMRTTIPHAASTVANSTPGDSFLWYHIWVGFTERAIATTLFIWVPGQLGIFIGGWTAAKLAAAWSSRLKEEHRPAQVLALLGTTISFCVAVGAGVYANPAPTA